LLEKEIPILIVSVRKRDVADWQRFKKELITQPHLQGMFAIVLVDIESLVNDLSLVLWFLSGNIDPSRDVTIVQNTDGNPVILVDGTRKAYPADRFPRLWPNIVAMDSETIDRVDQMWHWLDIGVFIESPSLRFISLNIGDDAVMRFQ
jgi:3-polyprenyl-4-hydroxybenzoate decarboxylase